MVKKVSTFVTLIFVYLVKGCYCYGIHPILEVILIRGHEEI